MKRRLAINVPASILQRPDFVSAIRRHFPKAADFPGLIAEITEDEAISNLQAAHDTAVQLRLYNVFVSIDDFGSQFSTLDRLTELPFVELKLDRRFVSGCSHDQNKLAMCGAVIELARRFKVATVAEGIETREDLRSIIDLGYDMAQGYVYAKPMPADEFRRFIRTHLTSR
jgi:EAL domain-containing protein (putative c-di-GMP-specific phosphodiesterase class I)